MSFQNDGEHSWTHLIWSTTCCCSLRLTHATTFSFISCYKSNLPRFELGAKRSVAVITPALLHHSGGDAPTPEAPPTKTTCMDKSLLLALDPPKICS